MHLTSGFITSALNIDFDSYNGKSIHKLLFIGLSLRCDNLRYTTISTDELMSFCLCTRPTVLSAIKYLETNSFIAVQRSSGELSSYKFCSFPHFSSNFRYHDNLVTRLLDMDLSVYKLKSIHKLVLICMASAADFDYSVSLTVQEIMSFCLATKPTVINAIKHLESLGVLAVTQKSGSSNVYYLLLDFFPTDALKLLGALQGYHDFPKIVPESPIEMMQKNDRSVRSIGLDKLILGLDLEGKAE
ncbi:transcriptional regulator [Vibrio fluvialis]|uniref:transcriptional regulator n=1 Tax=Vibrio fluvialis TaxID=676 RepID=UPI00301B792F